MPAPTPSTTSAPDTTIASIGGGNMASAIIGGLRRQGVAAERIDVVEPFEASRSALLATHGVKARAAAGDFLARAGLIVWAVKPQSFREAAALVAPHAAQALHLSVMAGIRAGDLAAQGGSATRLAGAWSVLHPARGRAAAPPLSWPA